MTLAIWNTSPAAFAVSGFTSGAVRSPFDRIVQRRPEVCAALLVSGEVDAALLPTVMVLQGAEGFDVVPGAALSTWKYPFARLVLKEGLRGPIRSVACDARALQERYVTRLVLREHYGADPEMRPQPEEPTTEALLAAEADAALLTGPSVPMLPAERLPSNGLALDLGQEWFEMANYPMAWGLFATRRGTAGPALVQALLDNVEAAEAHRATWIQAQEPPPALHAFYRKDLRLRYDDLVTASLTEFRRYLFYYDILDEVPNLHFVEAPEEEEDEEEGAWGKE